MINKLIFVSTKMQH